MPDPIRLTVPEPVRLDKPYCPGCTKDARLGNDTSGYRYSVAPVFLVKRTNSKTGDWFWGCPNFPSCKFTKSRPLTQLERDAITRAWAEAQGGGYGGHHA